MSFSVEVKKELMAVPIKLNCCKKALLLGLIYNSEHINDTHFRCEFSAIEIAELSARLMGNQGEFSIVPAFKGKRKVYVLEFSSKAVASFLGKVSNKEKIAEAAKFRCGECAVCFLRGILIAMSSITDPSKSYHLEISLLNSNQDRIDSLMRFFSDMDISTNITRREKKISLYFKANTVISDVLTYAGAKSAGFLVANTYIERDIRNNENRATNFVAKNISKSVVATQKQIASINKLKELDKLGLLSEELLETAKLRIENDDISLAELALMHKPPISKSGLNHRLEKICRFADEF